MSSINLQIENMHCGACVRRVTQALSTVPGVTVDEVNIGSARVHGDAASDAIVAAVVKAGYPAQVVNG